MSAISPKSKRRSALFLKSMTIAIGILCLVAADPATESAATTKEVEKLRGDWIIVSWELGGKTFTPEANDSRIRRWHFDPTQLTMYQGSVKEPSVKFEVRPGKSPKELDLIPIESDERAKGLGLRSLTKAIYSVEGDELKVAFSYIFAPMQPEEEIKLAMKLAGIRPDGFETKDKEIAVTTFKRAKAGAR